MRGRQQTISGGRLLSSGGRRLVVVNSARRRIVSATAAGQEARRRPSPLAGLADLQRCTYAASSPCLPVVGEQEVEEVRDRSWSCRLLRRCARARPTDVCAPPDARTSDALRESSAWPHARPHSPLRSPCCRRRVTRPMRSRVETRCGWCRRGGGGRGPRRGVLQRPSRAGGASFRSPSVPSLAHATPRRPVLPPPPPTSSRSAIPL